MISKNKIMLILIIGLAFSNSVISINIKKPEFEISLPDGWIETSSPRPDEFRYVFQLGNSEGSISCPYIVVRFRDVGRINESELKKMIQQDTNAAIEKAIRPLNLPVDEMTTQVYDESNRIVWSSMRANSPNGTRITVFGSILTENGTIELICFTAEDALERNLPVFKEIITSLKLSQELTYKSKPLGVDWKNNLPKGLGFLLAFLIILGVLKYARDHWDWPI